MRKRNEGIGAQIQKRKYSLILAAAVKGKWIGKLENEHNDGENRHFNYASLLGFPTDEDCTVSDIENEETTKHLSFSTIDMSRFDIHEMSRIVNVWAISALCWNILVDSRLGIFQQ